MRSGCSSFFFLLCLVTSIALSAPVAEPPPLAATLSHEIEEQGADGVLRISRYREHFFRNHDQVWIERELPGWAQVRAGESPAHELNIGSAAQWVRAGVNSSALLTLVDAAHSKLYSVAPPEFARAGFSGHWAAEASLIDPSTLHALAPLRQRSPVASARWYGRNTASDYEHILWDPQLQFPLVIETGRRDGRSRSETRVKLEPLPSRWPWEKLEKYARHELSDLSD
jgi:hypothetical protein